MTAPNAQLVLDCACNLGEGPVWHADALWFVDIYAGALHRYDPKTDEHESRPVAQHLGGVLSAAIPCTDGHWLLALSGGFALLDWENTRVEPLVALPEPHPNNRLNDAKADPSGRVWAGTMNNAMERDKAILYRLDHDHTITEQVDPVSLSNGLAWSADGKKMYYIDTPTKRVDVFDFDARAPEPHAPAINRRVLHELGQFDGSPDGMTIDTEGNLWVALWGGSRVVHIHGTTGNEIGEIKIPASQVTSCCFGGAELKDLYITTAAGGLNDEQKAKQPHAGGIFRAPLAVGGRPAQLYGKPSDR